VLDSRRDVLANVARHDVVVSDQIATALSLGRAQAEESLTALVSSEDLGRARVLRNASEVYWITEAGLARVATQLPAPVVSLSDLRSRLGATWAAVRAADGRFSGATVLTRREQSTRDASATRTGGTSARPIGLRVGGIAGDSDSRLHYPDVLLQLPRAWIAVHVALRAPVRRAVASFLTAYGADARYQRVVFLVEEERIALEIELVAESLGLAELVSVQWMDFRV
jgi:hypothetical protein